MSRSVFRLVLLIACGHLLVHVYELSLPSVEQLVAAEFDVGRATTGFLGTAFRLPFGLLALLAGWLADRYGARRILLVYLVGCSGAALLAARSASLAEMFIAMSLLGVFASVYHPAGASLISHSTTAKTRPMAMGYHGVFGSLGIGGGPFLAGLVLSLTHSWRGYYAALCLPGLILAALFWWKLPHDHPGADAPTMNDQSEADVAPRWGGYAALLVFTCLGGLVYAGVLNFLPRYLDEADIGSQYIAKESLRNHFTGVVLLLGIVGQYLGGRLGRPHNLELLLAGTFLAAAPCVLWMGFAHGTTRLVAAGLFAPLYFMHQPLYNSLLPHYVPRRRRSLAYGLSFTVGLGVGGFGAAFAGLTSSEVVRHGVLAGCLLAGGLLSLTLWGVYRRRPLR